MDEEIETLIGSAVTPKQAWDILKANFEPPSRARQAGLLDELSRIRYNPTTGTMGTYISKLKSVVIKLKETGYVHPDLALTFDILRHLPAEYDGLVQSLYQLDDGDFTVEKIEKALIAEEGRLRQKVNDQEASSIENAMVVKGKYESRKTSKTNPGYGKGPDQVRPNRNCYVCGKYGHWADRCFFNKKEKGGNSVKNIGATPGTSFLASAMMGDTDSSVWVIDSGATSHFCNQKALFKDFQKMSTKANIADKNLSSNIEGIGSVPIEVLHEGMITPILLQDVLYAPDFGKNLISGKRIILAKHHVVMTDGKARLFTPDWKIICDAVLKNEFFTVPVVKRNSGLTVNTHQENLWHQRLGHVNFEDLKSMVRKGAVVGVDLTKETGLCKICPLAKSTRASFKTSTRWTKSKLERIHMDLWGPSPVTTSGGNRYFLSIVDDFTRKVFTFPINNKRAVFQTFREWLEKIEKQSGTVVKAVRTDNGLEFVNSEFESLFKERGIVHERTSTYSPQQNGIAERYNRTAMNGVRSLLISSKLPSSLWGEALQTVTYLRNRTGHRSLQGRTPNELWTGRVPVLNHLKIFGSRAYVHTPKQRRTKLEPTAVVGYLVGYAIRTKGYRVWIPSEKKVIETIHVRFHEGIFKDGEVDSELGLTYTEPDPQHDIYSGDEEDTNEGGEYSERKEPEVTWTRKVKTRKDGSRTEVFYYPSTHPTQRMRSLNDVVKYCEKEKIEVDYNNFDFKTKTKLPSERMLGAKETIEEGGHEQPGIKEKEEYQGTGNADSDSDVYEDA